MRFRCLAGFDSIVGIVMMMLMVNWFVVYCDCIACAYQLIVRFDFNEQTGILYEWPVSVHMLKINSDVRDDDD